MTVFNVRLSRKLALLVFGLAVAALTRAQSGVVVEGEPPQHFVAGLAPYERPQGAPILVKAPAASIRAKESLHGIVEPVPATITLFLKDQGAWYTPFSWPGAAPPYDLRAWH